jgi:hypothetical protein
MDFFQFLIIVIACAGAGFVIYGIIPGKTPAAESGAKLDEKLSAFGETITEADNAINELNDLSRDVFAQFDEKYKELLFLYNMIDEKKREEGADRSAASVSAAVGRGAVKPRARGYHNEKFDKVEEMAKAGLGADEIAERLKVGKGEVSLILGLSRRG